jgi:hypothetical protein
MVISLDVTTNDTDPNQNIKDLILDLNTSLIGRQHLYYRRGTWTVDNNGIVTSLLYHHLRVTSPQ